MQIHLLFFGSVKDLAGSSAERLELPPAATVSSVLDTCAARYPKLQQFLPALAVAVNEEYVSRSAKLKDGDVVALIPPVSGGSTAEGGSRVAIVRTEIRADAIVAPLKRADDGAIVVFDGIVRNNTRGRRTLYLEYEAYEPMALKQMEALVGEALGKFPIRDARIVHRLGRLEIGETSVLIAVASAHRAAAFDACRWLIDTLKKQVPIWKKEYFEDGAVWADGEPFPPEVLKP
jgi:molybdopterin synthase catalytic subunit